MNDNIILSEFNAVGRLIIYRQSLSVQIAIFLTTDSCPMLMSSFYNGEELDYSIPNNESFMDIFAFRIFKNGEAPEEFFAFSKPAKINLYPVIQTALNDSVSHLKSKFQHHSLLNQTSMSSKLNFDLIKFDTWGRLFIDPTVPGIGVELASKLENGAIITVSKGFTTEDNQFRFERPAYFEVVSVVESGKYPTIYLIAPEIENETVQRLSRLVIYSAIEDLRRQSNVLSVSEGFMRSNNIDKSKLN